MIASKTSPSNRRGCITGGDIQSDAITAANNLSSQSSYHHSFERTRAVASQAVWYVAAFWVAFVPDAISTSMFFLTNGQVWFFWLDVFAYFLLPAQGFLNLLVFVRQRNQMRTRFGKFLLRLLCCFSTKPGRCGKHIGALSKKEWNKTTSSVRRSLGLESTSKANGTRGEHTSNTLALDQQVLSLSSTNQGPICPQPEQHRGNHHHDGNNDDDDDDDESIVADNENQGDARTDVLGSSFMSAMCDNQTSNRIALPLGYNSERAHNQHSWARTSDP